MNWPALAWQYADNAWATLDNVSPTEHGKADLLRIAQGLRGSPPYPARIVFQTTYLPAGYRLTSGGREADWPSGAGSFQATGTRYVNGPDQDISELVMPIIDSDNNGVRDMRINVYRRDWADNSTPPPGLPEGGVWCNRGNPKLCYRITPDGGWLAEVEGSGYESRTELVKIMAGLRFADVDDPSTWFPMK